jgi:hypothetical protein
MLVNGLDVNGAQGGTHDIRLARHDDRFAISVTWLLRLQD